jgi:hypothetical protein
VSLKENTMNTKIMIVAAVAALSLATTAFAGEGGRPEQQFDIVQVQANSSGYAAGMGSQQYPVANAAQSFQPLGEPTLPENGRNGSVQTANGLPAGFENGTVAFIQAQSVNRWYAQQADHRFALLHGGARPHG